MKKQRNERLEVVLWFGLLIVMLLSMGLMMIVIHDTEANDGPLELDCKEISWYSVSSDGTREYLYTPSEADYRVLCP